MHLVAVDVLDPHRLERARADVQRHEGSAAHRAVRAPRKFRHRSAGRRSAPRPRRHRAHTRSDSDRDPPLSGARADVGRQRHLAVRLEKLEHIAGELQAKQLTLALDHARSVAARQSQHDTALQALARARMHQRGVRASARARAGARPCRRSPLSPHPRRHDAGVVEYQEVLRLEQQGKLAEHAGRRCARSSRRARATGSRSAASPDAARSALREARSESPCAASESILPSQAPIAYTAGLACPDGGTGRRAGLKIRWWRHRVGSIPSPGTRPLNLWNPIEFLQPLRLARRIQNSRRGSSAAVRVHELRHDPLQESAAGAGLRSRVAGQDPAVPARDRAALRVLDGAGGIHGKRRDHAGRGGARVLRGGARERRGRLASRRGQRHPCRTGARDVPGAARRAAIRAGTGKSGGRPVRGGRDSLGRARVSQRRIHAAAVFRGPRRRPRGLIISPS